MHRDIHRLVWRDLLRKHWLSIMGIVIVLVLALYAAATFLPFSHMTTQRDRERSAVWLLAQVRSAYEAYVADNDTPPLGIADLQRTKHLDAGAVRPEQATRMRLNPGASKPSDWLVAYIWEEDSRFPSLKGQVTLLLLDGTTKMIPTREFR